MFEKAETKTRRRFFDYKNPLSIYDFLDGAKIQAARYNRLTRQTTKKLKNGYKKGSKSRTYSYQLSSF